jgi:hypothetical protein
MKIGLLSKSVDRHLNNDENDDLTPQERGKKIIYSALYHLTKPISIPLPLAAFALINKSSDSSEGLFFCSHEFVYPNLQNLCNCYNDNNNNKNINDDKSIKYNVRDNLYSTTNCYLTFICIC